MHLGKFLFLFIRHTLSKCLVLIAAATRPPVKLGFHRTQRRHLVQHHARRRRRRRQITACHAGASILLTPLDIDPADPTDPIQVARSELGPRETAGVRRGRVRYERRGRADSVSRAADGAAGSGVPFFYRFGGADEWSWENFVLEEREERTGCCGIVKV